LGWEARRSFLEEETMRRSHLPAVAVVAGLALVVIAYGAPPPRRRPRKPPKKRAKVVVKPSKKVVVSKGWRTRRVVVVPPTTVVKKTVVDPEVVTVEKQPQTCYVPRSMPATGEVELAAYFTPGEGPKRAALAELAKATQAVMVAMRRISDSDLTNALVNARKRGISVSVLVDADASASCEGSYDELAEGGVSVRLASAPGGMNNAFAVIDHSVLLVGSYDWTDQACENSCENMLLVRNATVASHYAAVFQGLWGSPELAMAE